MAKLSNFHILCPLIDQNNFLGVVSDYLNDCVVVTLGRNIIIRYKITDRKQVGSWSTREKLTSPVIFDHVWGHYVAVFNHKYMRIWKREDEDLDMVNKYKLPESVHTLVVACEPTVEPAILFQSGRAWKLSSFLEEKGKFMKSWGKDGRNGMNSILRDDEIMEEWHMVNCKKFTFIILSARAPSRPRNPTFYLLKLSDEDDGEYILQRKFTLQLKEAWLVGHTVIQPNGSCSLLTLWSNGKINRLSLDSFAVEDVYCLRNLEDSTVIETISPGCIVDSVKELFDLENKVAMVALGPHHIALYGADCSHKGAVVYIVDIHSSVTGELPWEALKESAAKQCLETYVKEIPPRLWNAAGHLFIPSSDGRLVLASYELGSYTPLANLIGCLGKKIVDAESHGISCNHDQLLRGSWISASNGTQERDEIQKFYWNAGIPQNVHSKLLPFFEKGLPESRICGIIFPELMNDADEESISWCLSHFNDIPEDSLVNLLSFILSRDMATPLKRKAVCMKTAVVKIPTFIAEEGSSGNLDSMESIQTILNRKKNEQRDTKTSDGILEASNKDDFEIGHVFVKGRRRSLRVMKSGNPQEEESLKDSEDDLRREIVNPQELADVKEETTVCVENKNSKMVVNGRTAIQEEMFGYECNVSEKLKDVHEESSTPDTSLLSEREGNIFKNIRMSEEGLKGMALSSRQRKTVEKLLSVPVSSFLLLPALRSKLSFDLALKLIGHLLWLLSSPEMDEYIRDDKLLDWICLLLDAFYQQYTLSQDDELLDTLQAVHKVLDFEIKLIVALKEMEPLLLQLISGRMVTDKTSDKWYSMENIRLY